MSLQEKADRLTKLLRKYTYPASLRTDPVTMDEAKFLIEVVKEQYMAKPKALIDVPPPSPGEKIVIGGDTHGQFRDVVRILDLNLWPGPKSKTIYLFLGDYVDRGSRNLETICTMFCLKAGFRKRFYILRGNHETEEINKHYGFRAECVRRFGDEPGQQLWKDFNECFAWMPLAALVGGRIFCMHGGIPSTPMAPNFDELRTMPLPIRSIRGNAIASDLLWSDPSDDVDDFVPNPRGLGHQFGMDQLKAFLTHHDLDLICRAHQVFPEGYKFMYIPREPDPRLATVFSAPNYGGEFNNRAAALVLDDTMQVQISQVLPYRANAPGGKN